MAARMGVPWDGEVHQVQASAMTNTHCSILKIVPIACWSLLPVLANKAARSDTRTVLSGVRPQWLRSFLQRCRVPQWATFTSQQLRRTLTVGGF